MKRPTIASLILLFSLTPLRGATYEPLQAIDTLPVSPPAYDLLVYGGYLYTSSRETIGIYDMLSGTPVLKGTITLPTPTTLIPRLYRWKNQLIIPYYTDAMTNGIYFYDLTDPTHPTLIHRFNHEYIYKDWYRGFPVSGFPSEDYMGRCTVGGDYLVCPWTLDDDDPAESPNLYVGPAAFHLPDYEHVWVWVSLPDVECGEESPLEPVSMIFVHDRYLWPWGWAYCDILYDTIDGAYQRGDEDVFSCRFCDFAYYDYSLISPTGTFYKRWLLAQYANSITQDPIADYWWLAGKPAEFPPGACARSLPDPINVRIQMLYGHEEWIYGTEYGCGYNLANYNPNEPWLEETIVGINEVATMPYALTVVNDTLYVAGESAIYRFDPVRHDRYKPQGEVKITQDEGVLHVEGLAWDDDGIQGVYVRLNDALLTGREFTSEENLFDDSRHHAIPMHGPRSFRFDVDVSSLSPGAWTLRVIVVDREESFSVIDEREVTLGSVKTARKGCEFQ